jgi:ABC-2 type transport system permease protein
MYEQLLDAAPGVGATKRTHKPNQNLRQLLFSYNSQLIRDPNLIMQVFSNSILMPMIFIIAFAVTGQINLNFLGMEYLGVCFTVGIALATLSVNPMSFVANIISLDKENFLFIRSLPLSMTKYLKEKFRFAGSLQLIINAVIVVATGIFFHLPFILLVSALLGNIVATYLLSLRYFARDYRLLLLDWTNISQLFTRGAGNTGLVFLMMGSMLLNALLIALYVVGVMMYPFWWINGPVFILLVIGCVSWYLYYQRNFWQRFD